MSKPAAEIELSEAQVRDLLSAQHAQFAHLPITAGPSGWDNMIFRLGDDLAVRLPRRAAAARLLEHEQRWLPQLASQLPLPIPAPVCIGLPCESFPWHWSITPWFAGETLDRSSPAADQVEVLASFLQALHTPAPADAPFNPWRSVPLIQRRIRFEECALDHENRGSALGTRLRQIWDRAVNTPIDVMPAWIHADLHPRNVLVHDGRISAVIDWGDLAQGDRAADLAAVWMLLPRADDRESLMSRYRPASTQTWMRARGWALLYALIVLRSEDPEHQEAGQATLDRLREGP
jgi:aminoglycoside phosphotransferase (APT) family kinase protein